MARGRKKSGRSGSRSTRSAASEGAPSASVSVPAPSSVPPSMSGAPSLSERGAPSSVAPSLSGAPSASVGGAVSGRAPPHSVSHQRSGEATPSATGSARRRSNIPFSTPKTNSRYALFNPRGASASGLGSPPSDNGVPPSMSMGDDDMVFGTDLRQEETIQRCVRFLRNCTTSQGEVKYMPLIREMLENEQFTLEVDAHDLDSYDPELYEKMVRYAADAIVLFDNALARASVDLEVAFDPEQPFQVSLYNLREQKPMHKPRLADEGTTVLAENSPDNISDITAVSRPLSTAPFSGAASLRRVAMPPRRLEATQPLLEELVAAREASEHTRSNGSTVHCAAPFWRPGLAILLVGNGAFLFGFHLAVINGPLGRIAEDLGCGNNPVLQGVIVSSLLAGGAIGSLGGSGLADKFGRRRSCLLACVPLFLCAILTATAKGLSTITAGRLLGGVGVGLTSSVVPVYISEVAPTRLRGAFGTWNQLLITSGNLTALVINALVPAEHWRWVMALSALPTFILLIGMCCICPETPRWLMHQRKSEEAARAAKWLWGDAATSELEVHPSPEDDEPQAAFSELFAKPNRMVAATAVMMFLLQQFAGINALVYFSSTIFKQAGVASDTLASAAVFTMNVGGTVIAGGLIERLGRKTLLMGSYAGMGGAMAAMAASMAIPQLKGVSAIVAVLGVLTYILSFAHGAGPVPMLLIPEIAPHRVRGRAVALAMTSHWVCNFMVGQLFLPIVRVITVVGAFAFFAIVCGVAVLYTAFFVVETKGRSLEEIEAAMGSRDRGTAGVAAP